jgi:hypothetical protein
MKKKGISFFEDFNTGVKLNLSSLGNSRDAKLIIKGGKLPTIDFDPLSLSELGNIRLSDEEKKLLPCDAPTKHYKLIDCETNGNFIYPRYIAENLKDEPIIGVEIALTGLSTWFDQCTRIKITDTELTLSLPDKKIDELVEINNSKYRISSHSYCDVENVEKKDYLVSGNTTIKIVKIDGNISENSAENLSHDIRRLFSLLLGQPLSIEYVWLIVDNPLPRRPFYFGCVGKKEEPFESPNECIIHPSFVFAQNMWGRIFEAYYSPPTNEIFKAIWSRLPTFFAYGGIWEHEIVGHVSTLDAYCNQFTKNKGEKLPKSTYQEIKKNLLVIIDEAQREIDSKFYETTESIKVAIKRIGNTNLATFKEKFKYLMLKIDDDVREMINFSEKDFQTIKEIRDLVVHGEPVKTRNGQDISFESEIKYKLQVFLLFLVYKDFGFSPTEYALCLKRTLCKYVKNSKISKFKRDKLAGVTPFCEVRKDNFLKASKSNKFNVAIKFYKDENIYRYSETVTKEIDVNWLRCEQKIHRSMVDHVKAFIEDTDPIDVIYQNEAYLLCGEKYLKLSGVCLITYKNKQEGS